MSADNLPARPGGRGAGVLVLDVQTGKVVWQKEVHERGGGYGLSDVPLIDGERIYLRANHQLLCVDRTDGNVIWSSDAAKQDYFDLLHGPNGTGLILGDYWWVPTSFASGSDCSNWYTNSVEWPWHPSVVVVDKKTGQRVAEDDLELQPMQHGQWSSLSSAVVDGRRLVFFGDGAGYVHAFEAPERFDVADGEVAKLKEVWTCDANPKEYRQFPDGTPMPYSAYMGYIFGPTDIGWAEIVSTPVYHKGRLYVAIGRDVHYSPRKGRRRVGNGALTCIDVTGEGDVTETHKIWTNTDLKRTFSTPSITDDGLLFVASHAGYLTCVDIETGETVWKRDINQTIWNYSQVVADGKVFVMNEGKDFFIFSADREGKQLFHVEVDGRNNPQPGVTDGILVVGTSRSITAYGGPEYMKTHPSMGPLEKKDIPEDEEDDGHH
jgi:outer membrane protein assembly factor BamB